MKLRRPRQQTHSETIVALIDVVFFLLVFFMMTGRMDATAPFAVMPPVGDTGSEMPSGGVTISVDSTGELALDGFRLTTAEMDAKVADRLAETPDLLIRVNADRSTALRFVLPVVSRLEELGARDVVLVVTTDRQ
jgi:biopolymer transport protein ExbD